MASRAQRFLTDCHARVAAAPRPTLYKGYHRAAAAAALVGLAASVRAGDQSGRRTTSAEEHARAAGDGPLLAELWLTRSVEEGAAAHAREIGSPVACATFSRRSRLSELGLRAVLGAPRPGERVGAGRGGPRGAHRSRLRHLRRRPRALVAVDRAGGGCRRLVLRQPRRRPAQAGSVGRWEAEAALQLARSRGIVSDVYGAVECARLRLATGDAHAAAAHLAADPGHLPRPSGWPAAPVHCRRRPRAPGRGLRAAARRPAARLTIGGHKGLGRLSPSRACGPRQDGRKVR